MSIATAHMLMSYLTSSAFIIGGWAPYQTLASPTHRLKVMALAALYGGTILLGIASLE
jgi:cytochrome bd-type quinol oxidase subunit 1